MRFTATCQRALKLYKLDHDDRWSMHDVKVPVFSRDYINIELKIETREF